VLTLTPDNTPIVPQCQTTTTMSAGIVYEGVKGSYEGTLFGGIKFFISQRVPCRSTWVDALKVSLSIPLVYTFDA